MCTKEEFLIFVINNNYQKFYENVSIKLINKENIFISAVKLGRNGFVHFMINKVVDIEVVKEAASIHQKGNSIGNLLNNRVNLVDAKLKAGYNRLHIAVMDNEADLVDYLLRKYPLENNDSIMFLGTPLHLAIMLCHYDCVKTFITHGVDVNIANKNNITAVQQAVMHKIPLECKGIFALSEKMDELKYNGLNILQMAVVYESHECIESILEKSEDITVEIMTEDAESMVKLISQHCSLHAVLPLSDKENSVTLFLKYFKRIHSSFIDKLNNESITMTDGYGNGLLHLAASLQDVDLCTLLIKKGINVNIINDAGNNALIEMINNRTLMPHGIKKPVQVGELLLDNGIDTSINGSDGKGVLYKSSELNNEKFFIKVFNTVKSIYFSVSDFESISKRRWFTAVNTILSRISKESKERFITLFVVNLYYDYTTEDDLLNLMKQCSNTVRIEVIDKILNRVALKNEMNLFKEYLEFKIVKGNLIDNKETLLTNLILKEKSSFLNILLESVVGTMLLNISNASGESPLHLAIKSKNKSLIDVFIFEINIINVEDKEGQTVLGLLFQHFNSEEDIQFLKRTSKTIICRGGNLHHKNMKGIEDIDHCFNVKVKENVLEFEKNQFQRICYNKECIICLNNPINCCFDCGHVFCDTCASKVDCCPSCRKSSAPFRLLFL